MAVRRIVAAIDVVINGQRNLDRLAEGYLAVERTMIRATTAMGRTTAATTAAGRAFQAMTSPMRTVATGFNSLVTSIEKGRAALDSHGKTTRGFTDNIVSLTKSMLLFSVLLPLVQMPQRAIESFADFVKVGAAWQDQMRVSNALLGLNEQQFKNYNIQVQDMAIRNGVATESMKDLLQMAASSVSAIKPNTEALNNMGKAAYDASVALELANQSARIARATGTDAAESTTTLIQVMSTYGLTMEHVADVSDSLFAITDVGTVRFQELEATLPRVTAAMGPLIQRYDTADDKMKVMNESFAAFAAMTQTMPAEQAATSFANIFKDVNQMTGKQKELVQSWEKIRKQQGMGEDMSLMPENLLNQGPLQTLVQMRKIFDIHGPMVDAYVKNQRRLGNAAEEGALRTTGQAQLMGSYFEDMRAVRGFQNTSVEQLQRAQTDFEASRNGAVDRGLGQRDKSFLDAQNRFGVSVTALKTSLFQSIEEPMTTGINPITEMFGNLVKDANFQNADFLSKLRILGDTMMTQFTNYFRSGGKGQIQTVGRDIGLFLGESITSFFKGGKDNVLVEAASAFSEAFISGIGQTLPEMLKAMLTSKITQAVVEAVSLRYITKGRMPEAASRGLSLAVPAITTAASSGDGLASYALPALGAVATGAAMLAAFRRGKAAPVFGSGFNAGFGQVHSINDLGATVDLAAAAQAGAGRAGRSFPGIGSTLGRLGKVAGGGILTSAALTLPDILAAKTDRERWEAIGGGVGGVIGGVGGGMIGGGVLSPLMAIAGSMALGTAGRWAGGKLWEHFNPATGAGSGADATGAAQMDVPERVAMAEMFATGFDSSLAVPLLTQIRDILGRGGVGTSGVVSVASTSTGGGKGPPADAPTNGGALSANFVNQMDKAQLTPSQASAACGPAAAAFFAKAYGRNPTLKEAYALVTQIQGSDPSGPNGTRGVGVLGSALESLGVPNETSANIDWGRLANDAQNGTPGIVNIGPRGKFPGHFFQIGGWDPTTNKFNVGSSGTVLAGGKDWMTPEEMLALGPAQGAVYGGTGGKGPGVSAADIASMQGGAATGAGPGAQGGTTINIQNLMTVEHMDGNTDIRALMGQMAEMLRQLSTGGSVVGQTGQVAPP